MKDTQRTKAVRRGDAGRGQCWLTGIDIEDFWDAEALGNITIVVVAPPNGTAVPVQV